MVRTGSIGERVGLEGRGGCVGGDVGARDSWRGEERVPGSPTHPDIYRGASTRCLLVFQSR